MGLKVWLPLNETLENKGAGNITFSNTTPTYATNGKIGSALNIYATPQITINIPSLVNAQQFSFAFWYKPQTNSNNTSNWQLVFALADKNTSGTTGRLRIESSYGSVASTYAVSIHNNSSYGIASVGYVLSSEWNTWHHIVFTCDGIKCRGYCDGVLKKEENFLGGTLTGTGYIGSPSANSGADGLMNDLRIYDHCLSAAEVREISQGLVLHYKLDDPNPNMFLMTPKSYTPTSYCGYQLSFNENLVANQAYTLQLWDVTVEHSAKTAAQMNLCVYWGGGSVVLKNFNGASNFTTLRDHYAYSPYLIATFTPTTTQAAHNDAAHAWFNMYNSVGWVSGTVNMHIGAWKLEKGDVATSWTPTNTVVIQDSSGYNHNGTITGNLSLSNNTPRYQSSIYFEDYTRYISCLLDNNWIPDAITMSCWIKGTNRSARGGYHIPLNMHSTNFEISITSSSGLARMGYVVGGTRYVSDIGSNILDGNWHMLTSTFNGSTICRYIDGTLIHSENRSGALTAVQTLGVGTFPGGTTYSNTQLYESDVRIYATALDADAIRQLYEVGAKVDNKQNLHTFELAELNSGRELLAWPLTSPFYNHTAVYSAYDTNGEITLTGNSSVGSGYIKINPTGHTYYYDIDVSTDNGNVFYIGFEKYDVNKTARSNNACVYLNDLSGGSSARTHAHYHGTVNLATDGVNPTDTIALRILNDWSGANGRKATIHRLSLREVPSLQTSKINKKGQVITDELIELDGDCRIQKNGTVETNEIIEL